MTPIATFLPCRCGAQQPDTSTADGTTRTHSCQACGTAVSLTAGNGVTLLRQDLIHAWNAAMFRHAP